MHQSQRNKPPYPVRESNSPIGYYQLTRGQLLGFDFFPKNSVCVCHMAPKIPEIAECHWDLTDILSENKNVCHACHGDLTDIFF